MLKYLVSLTFLFAAISCANSNGSYTNPDTTVIRNNDDTNKKIESESSSSYKTELLTLVNQLRKKGCRCGRKRMKAVPPLTWNDQLEKAAKAHARDMAKNDFFDHKGSNGSSISDRVEKTGYSWNAVGENIFWGEADVQRVFQGWKKSKSHCKTMMDPNYKEMGAAFVGLYWVQDFGRTFN